MSKIAVIIPARWGSTRFPGKALALVAGKPLVLRVIEQARRARQIDRVIVATDDRRIFEAVESFGCEARMTSSKHVSGTDRIAEVVRKLPEVAGIINVQGDEPLMDPALIDRLARRLKSSRPPPMLTAAIPFADPADAANPNNVKVVIDQKNRALYFSRSLIPHPSGDAVPPLHHFGVYGYTREFLLRFVRWKPAPLELCERLEQLRALHHGFSIEVLIAKKESLGVDSPDDVKRVEEVLAGS